MSDSLSIYLEDHLAGAAYAIDLVEYMRDQHKGEELGQFAAELLIDINADQKILQQLADRAGAGSSALKEVTAWLGEKITRLKLRHEAGDSLGVFEALEFLSGDSGKAGTLECFKGGSDGGCAFTRCGLRATRGTR